MRVLATELRRIRLEGGEVVVEFGSHTIGGDRLSSILAGL
jgi:hypothetical protein